MHVGKVLFPVRESVQASTKTSPEFEIDGWRFKLCRRDLIDIQSRFSELEETFLRADQLPDRCLELSIAIKRTVLG